MDKNTITGLILIFLIFIGFSIYRNGQLNKEFEKAVGAAETELTNGNLERARMEYVNALRFKPNQPDVLQKISELNLELDTIPGVTEQNTDTVKQETGVNQTLPQSPVQTIADSSQYGAFADAAK